MLKGMIYNTTLQKVLYFLLAHPDEKYYDREISRLAKVSKAATNFALRDLMKANFVEREKKGRMYFYYIDSANSLIRQLKIVQNLINISSLTEKLKQVSIKIILYGSAARGENHTSSDIDLYILSREEQKAKDILYNSAQREKIQYLINTPQEFNKLKKTNPVFHKELLNGIIVYEVK